MSFEYKVGGNKKYPYQLVEAYSYELPDSWPRRLDTIITPYLALTTSHVIIMDKSYAWNGADMTWDTARNIRASLVHDALCQLIERGRLPFEPYRKLADQAFYQICREDGVWWITAQMYYRSIRFYVTVIKPFLQWWNSWRLL